MRALVIFITLITGLALVIVGYGDAPDDKLTKTVGELEQADLGSRDSSARGWVRAKVASGAEVDAPVSGDSVIWWQTVTVRRVESTQKRCEGTDCTDETTVAYNREGAEQADGPIPLTVDGQSLEVSVPYASIKEVMEADGPAGSVDALKSNASSNSSGSGDDATLHEYVVRTGDELTIIGAFTKQDDRWHVTALPEVPIATSRTFSAYRDDVLASGATSSRLKLAGSALLAGSMLVIVLSIVRRRRRAAESPLP